MALKTSHFFPFLKLMKALNIKDEFLNIVRQKMNGSIDMTDDQKSQALQEKGVELVFMLIEKMPDAEREIKAFLALYSGKTPEELDELPVEEFIELIKQVLREPSFKLFFQRSG